MRAVISIVDCIAWLLHYVLVHNATLFQLFNCREPDVHSKWILEIQGLKVLHELEFQKTNYDLPSPYFLANWRRSTSEQPDLDSH